MPQVTTIAMNALDPFLEFAKACYRPRHILTDPSFLHWQFAAPWERNSALYVIQDRSGKVLAHSAGVSVPFWWAGETIEARMSMSLMSRPEVRGFGLGIWLVRHVQATSPVTIALAMSLDALALHEGLGFKPLGYLNRYFFITSPSAVAPLLPAGRSAPEFTEPTFDPCGSTYTGPLNDSFTALFEKAIGDRFGVKRSGEYLEWRYRAMPFYRYEIRVAADASGRPQGILVWRRDATEPTGAVAGRIVELFGEPDVLPGLVSGVVAQARAENVAYLDAFFAAERDGKSLLACGFKRAAGEYERLLTHWTHPAHHSENPLAYNINTAVYASKPLDTGWDERERWYLTKSDSDQDRPAQLP